MWPRIVFISVSTGDLVVWVLYDFPISKNETPQKPTARYLKGLLNVLPHESSSLIIIRELIPDAPSSLNYYAATIKLTLLPPTKKKKFKRVKILELLPITVLKKDQTAPETGVFVLYK